MLTICMVILEKLPYTYKEMAEQCRDRQDGGYLMQKNLSQDRRDCVSIVRQILVLRGRYIRENNSRDRRSFMLTNEIQSHCIR